MNYCTKISILSVLIFLFLFIAALSQSLAQTSFIAKQPESGPGGADYKHYRVMTTCYGEGAEQFYLYEPYLPQPDTAPLIAFLHGWNGINPEAYGHWIEHIVKKGNIVVFPIYQTEVTIYDDHLRNSLQAIAESIDVLQKEKHINPDLDKFALVGHSQGGILAVNIAALAQEKGLPPAKAIMSVQPGLTSPLEDLSKITADTLLLTIVGDQDTKVGDIVAKNIFWETTQIPFENKNFILMLSDYYRFTSITADHYAPCCRYFFKNLIPVFKTNALDFYGFWKLFDGLTDAAFYGKNREYALGNTPQQKYMGEWSNGTPRKELIIIDQP